MLNFNSTDIYKTLSSKYEEERYYITNAFVFEWESDILFKTSSGLFVEIEVKISRNDFKKDFTKTTKHQILQQGRGLIRQELHYLTEFDETHTIRERDEVTFKSKKVSTGKRKSVISSNLKYFLNKEFNVTYTEHSCGVHFKKQLKRPNKFYYACPEGLIKPEEVPFYAGLIWIKDGSITIIKKAKQIHKEKVDLNRELLEKFYWRYKTLTNERRSNRMLAK